jgi:pilus assembly protein Flp/PilA
MTVLEKLRLQIVGLLVRASLAIRNEEGATLVEYGLLVALIAVVVMAALSVLGVRINGMFCSVVNTLGGSNCQ